MNLEKPIEKSNLYRESLSAICLTSIDLWKHSQGSQSFTVKCSSVSNLAELEEQRIRTVIKHEEGNIRKVAEVLNISKSALYRKIKKFKEPL